MQTVLSQLDGTARTRLIGEIDTGRLRSRTDVIDNDGAVLLNSLIVKTTSELVLDITQPTGPTQFEVIPQKKKVGSGGPDMTVEKLDNW